MAGMEVSGIYSATYSSVSTFHLISPISCLVLVLLMVLTSSTRSQYMSSKSRVIVLCDGGPTIG